MKWACRKISLNNDEVVQQLPAARSRPQELNHNHIEEGVEGLLKMTCPFAATMNL
jgi:hypothetical protein